VHGKTEQYLNQNYRSRNTVDMKKGGTCFKKSTVETFNDQAYAS
jgi:hypothetical protein